MPVLPSDLGRDAIEFRPRRLDRPVRLDLERISLEPRENVDVQMEYRLEGRLTIRQEEVDALTPKPGATDGRSGSLGHREEMGNHPVIQVVQIRRVLLGHDEEVAGVDRSDRGGDKRPVIFMNDACWSAPGHNLAEDARDR